MQTFSVHEAKTHLSRLLAMVEQGEDVVVTKSGKPVVRLTPFHKSASTTEGEMGLSVKVRGDIIGPFHDAWGDA